jgi:methionyl-tRNA formyltransferase
MRLILMGTGPFGLPAFQRLYEGPHEVVLVLTAPRRPARGRGPAAQSPVRALAEARRTTLLDPERVNEDAVRRALAAAEAQLLVVCDYGQILSAETLATTPLGGVNLHGSLLPRYRGAAPVAWAIFHGETETGVSVIHMTPRLDAGPVIAQARLAIDPDETAGALEERLAVLGGGVVTAAIDDLAAGRARPIAQDPSLVSRAPRLRKEQGAVDWTRPAEAIRNQVRAFEPWPRSHTAWHRPGAAPLRLVLGPIAVEPRAVDAPGTVLEARGGRLVVAAGEGA